MHTLYIAYVKHKYDRKVQKISSAFYDITESYKLELNTVQLFILHQEVIFLIIITKKEK